MPASYYLKLGSIDEQVQGDSRDPNHRGWIKLESIAQISSQSGAHGAGPGAGGKVTASAFTMTKRQDRASMAIMNATATGRHFKTATIEIADAQTGAPKLRFILSDVMVGSFTNPRNGLGYPLEEVSLTFGGIEINNNPIPDGPITVVLQSLRDLIRHHTKP